MKLEKPYLEDCIERGWTWQQIARDSRCSTDRVEKAFKAFDLKTKWSQRQDTNRQLAQESLKECAVDGVILPTTDFYKNSRSADGLMAICKKHQQQRNQRIKKEKYYADLESSRKEGREGSLRRRKQNPRNNTNIYIIKHETFDEPRNGYCPLCDWPLSHVNQVGCHYIHTRFINNMKNYGGDIMIARTVFRMRNCECCNIHLPDHKPICLDHNHQTGLFRGGLCSTCNSAMGHMKDDPNRTMGLYHYILQTPPTLPDLSDQATGACLLCEEILPRGRRLPRLYCVDHTRRAQTIKLHGITINQYRWLFEYQRGQCAACKDLFGVGAPHIDHCHTEDHVRGLLCSDCNPALGQLGDDPERIQALVKYLSERSGQSAPSMLSSLS